MPRETEPEAPRPKGVMHLLFDIFVLPPAVIAGVIFIATWNLCDAGVSGGVFYVPGLRSLCA